MKEDGTELFIFICQIRSDLQIKCGLKTGKFILNVLYHAIKKLKGVKLGNNDKDVFCK